MSEEEELVNSKKVAFYSAVVQAWIATRMEKDRTLLTLSSGGIGLLATLLATVGPSSRTELVLYGLAGASFIGSIVASVLIFHRNSDHLEDVVLREARGDDHKLKRLDAILFTLFLAGVVLTGAIAMVSGYSRIRKDRSMSQGDRENTKVIGSGTEQRSLTGIGNLAPASSPAQPGTSGDAAGAGPAAGGQGTSTTQDSGAPNQGSKK